MTPIKSPRLQIIVDEAARLWGVEVSDILGPSRRHVVADPRHAAMAVARDITGMSLTALARAFDRHHTTVLDGIARAQMLDRAAREKSFQVSFATRMKDLRSASKARIARCPRCQAVGAR